jgi:hypothetical protein
MSQLGRLLIFFADKSFVAWPDIPAELHDAWRVARKRGLLAADYSGLPSSEWGPDAERHECYRHLCKYSLTEAGKDALAELRISQAAVEKETPPADPTATPPEPPWPEYMSAKDLSNRLGLPPDATRKKLERLAGKYDCFIDNESPRRGEAKRLYRVADVLPHIRP